MSRILPRDVRPVRPGSWRLAPAVACGAAGLLLAGCMVGPDYAPKPPALPADFGEAHAAAEPAESAASGSEAQWWQRFEDPGLRSLVERAIAANPSLRLAGARVRAARAARDMAQSLLYPRIGVGASFLRFQASDAAVGLPGADLDGKLYQVGFDAQWVVDLFGGTRRSVESAAARVEGTAAERRGVVVAVAAETARAYLELRGAQRQLAVAQATLASQRETLAVTEARNAHGLASDLEVVRARTETESTAAEIPPLEHAIRAYVHVLSTLLALPPTALSDELATSASTPAVPQRIEVGVPSDLLRRRPDLQAAERRIAGASAMVGVATAQLFPQLVLGGSAGLASRQSSELANGGSDRNGSNYYFAGPSIDWTLFDWGRRRARIAASEAEVEAAKAEYENAVLAAFREVESALVAVDRGRVRVADLERLVTSAQGALAIAQADYRNGLLDQLTVLDAQRQASRAAMLLVQGQVTLAVDAVRLYQALGGGWEAAEPPATAAQ